jgi:uncharacterized protein (TIGR01777 family)
MLKTGSRAVIKTFMRVMLFENVSNSKLQKMGQRILITGGTGLVGSCLTAMLLNRGHQVVHVSRKPAAGYVPVFLWDVNRGELDARALEGVDAVVHLAGAGVADARWTPARKKEILHSRVAATQLLKKHLAGSTPIRTVVAASAIGYYGFSTTPDWLDEQAPAGSDFLAGVTRRWEESVDELADSGRRIVKLRIGIVLSEKGGALPQMAKPVQWGVGAPLGSGHQYMSWIHLDDLCAMFIYALENPALEGVYNAVGPQPATNREVTAAIAQTLRRPLWLPPVPGLVLRTLLGEMAEMVLNGSRVSAAKITQAGFQFSHPALGPAIQSLLQPGARQGRGQAGRE